MKVQVNWDTDNESIDLPNMVDVPDNMEEEDIADWLSDKYGWCVNSFVTIELAINKNINN